MDKAIATKPYLHLNDCYHLQISYLLRGTPKVGVCKRQPKFQPCTDANSNLTWSTKTNIPNSMLYKVSPTSNGVHVCFFIPLQGSHAKIQLCQFSVCFENTHLSCPDVMVVNAIVGEYD